MPRFGGVGMNGAGRIADEILDLDRACTAQDYGASGAGDKGGPFDCLQTSSTIADAPWMDAHPPRSRSNS
jgi:hypothetical protein